MDLSEFSSSHLGHLVDRFNSDFTLSELPIEPDRLKCCWNLVGHYCVWQQ